MNASRPMRPLAKFSPHRAQIRRSFFANMPLPRLCESGNAPRTTRIPLAGNRSIWDEKTRGGLLSRPVNSFDCVARHSEGRMANAGFSQLAYDRYRPIGTPRVDGDTRGRTANAGKQLGMNRAPWPRQSRLIFALTRNNAQRQIAQSPSTRATGTSRLCPADGPAWLGPTPRIPPTVAWRRPVKCGSTDPGKASPVLKAHPHR